MSLTFDLISDLEITPSDPLDWFGKPTSLFCVVAGNISSDRDTLFETLEHLSSLYECVFYVDGPLDHRNIDDTYINSYVDFVERTKKLDNVMFLHNDIVVVEGVALIASNGWCTYDFDAATQHDTIQFLNSTEKTDMFTSNYFYNMGINDSKYLEETIRIIQTMPDIKKAAIITNAVPLSELVDHDPSLEEEYKLNQLGNSRLIECLDDDFENKVVTWCFGRYQGDLDFDINDIRFVNNPANITSRNIYNPKRITIKT